MVKNKLDALFEAAKCGNLKRSVAYKKERCLLTIDGMIFSYREDISELKRQILQKEIEFAGGDADALREVLQLQVDLEAAEDSLKDVQKYREGLLGPAPDDLLSDDTAKEEEDK